MSSNSATRNSARSPRPVPWSKVTDKRKRVDFGERRAKFEVVAPPRGRAEIGIGALVAQGVALLGDLRINGLLQMVERIGPAVAEELDLEEECVALDAEAVLGQSADAKAKPASRFRRNVFDSFGQRTRAGAVTIFVASGNQSHDAADFLGLSIGKFAVNNVPLQRETGGGCRLSRPSPAGRRWRSIRDRPRVPPWMREARARSVPDGEHSFDGPIHLPASA